jgi:AraC-like DNA-binding protein
MSNNLIIVLNIVGIALCFLIAFVLLSFNTIKSSAKNILAAYFFVLGCGLICLYTFITKSVTRYPHFFRTTLLAGYAFPPLAYLYVRQNIRTQLNIKDLVHFIPLAFYIVDFIPFFILSAAAKLPIVSAAMQKPDTLLAHSEGWLTPAWFHLLFRNFICLLYSFLSLRLLLLLQKIQQPNFFKDNLKNIVWLRLFVVLQFFFYVPYIFFVIIGKSSITFNTASIPFVLVSTITASLLFFQPSIIYGFNGIIYLDEVDIKNNNHQQAGYKKVEEHSTAMQLAYLNTEETNKIKIKIEESIVKKFYLQQGYSINDLARDTAIPARKISAFLNKAENINYRDFINQLRIEYCKQKLQTNEWDNLTLEAIALECGFSNRNSFSTAFKKIQGSNPSEFIAQLKH